MLRLRPILFLFFSFFFFLLFLLSAWPLDAYCEKKFPEVDSPRKLSQICPEYLSEFRKVTNSARGTDLTR